jgi:protein O-GlcNAc transferase
VTIPQALQIALQHHQSGRLANAEALYRQILAVQPNQGDALHLLGLLASQAGRHQSAADLIRRAIAVNPANLDYYINLGNALVAQGQLDEAITTYGRVLQFKPDFAMAHNNLGATLKARGRLDEAIASYRRALRIDPGYTDVHNNLGVALQEKGQLDEAVGACRRAIQIKPDHTEAWYNLGIALKSQGHLDEASGAFRRALQIKPDHVKALNNLGVLLKEQGHFDAAIGAHSHSLRLEPDYVEARINLGNALRERGRLDEAVAAYRRALELKSDYAEAHYNLGIALRERGQLDEAVAAYRRALEIKPDLPEVHNNLANAFKALGQMDEAVAAYRRALELNPEHVDAHSNLVYALHFHPGVTPGAIAQERQRWNRRFGEPLKQFALPHANDPGSERPLRVGYVSPDFREHVVGRNLWPLFKRHNRRDFEILCYAGAMQEDALTEEFRRHAGQWRSTVGVGDEALAAIIQADGVDILVDLTQHMAGNRLPVFARKPAPIQVSFAGYPESTGLEAIEYRISDRHLEAGSADGETGRKETVCLINSFWCYDPCGVELEVNLLPALKSGTVTFGCLGNFCKVSERVLRLWARALREVKDSRLVLLTGFGSHRERTLEVFEREGIESGRVDFVETRPRKEYLELYQGLDIVLDTFPYNGHTTSLDSLWMGVPVVSLAGETPVSRAGLSQLTNVGLPELAAHSEEDYVRIAVELAGDLPRLAQLRSTLRDRMKRSVLMDASRFASSIEAAYRAMWKAWSHGQSPAQE